jgi:hypothetical protein
VKGYWHALTRMYALLALIIWPVGRGLLAPWYLSKWCLWAGIGRRSPPFSNGKLEKRQRKPANTRYNGCGLPFPASGINLHQLANECHPTKRTAAGQ